MFYVHGDKDSNYEEGTELGLEGEALDKFSYTGYEIGLALEVNPSTGVAMCIGIEEGNEIVRLERPVKV